MSYIASIFKDFAKLKWYSLAIVIVLIFISVFLFLAQKRQKFTTKALVYGGVAISLSFILSFIKFYRMPQGGSITPASMLPLFAYAYMFGPFAGIVAGMAYGILQLIQDPYVVHWAQLLLDYPLSFGALGFAGFFRKNLPLGILAGGFGRFVFHFISGVVFFASYAPKGTSPVVYSAIYNATYLGPDLAVCLIIAFIPGLRSAIDRLKSQA
ncbi:thiamine transporter [Caldicellulosiruptor bescii]|uniref:Proton-coupled thiamine transporter YuaJ n=2 Tax=Caldicellulosiruptor bescii TaxID=31899 RepID=B9MLJ1_CALBD|nr:energy-coupled thiamine transporter ThiT [Caldicellulosiruptor bescii]ACM59199.1 proton-coupled thiamine transporter YuaJ [Caldicellulosiruptor bescii DSM 6725]PBC88345.1 thiamine transporter [Caldicellulosiruptor bescii]PBC92174.1 thiamine transporter [Caldicellulosiruptor bescii]PBD05016.1 thiamine transporter [Caldicellulosiruptor bescii]PBD05353.1 thiamine transporter [Caldicellulosiruptor bescii]